MKTVEEIEQAIRDELLREGFSLDPTARIGGVLAAVEIVDLILALEGRFECPEITLGEVEISLMTTGEFATALQGFLEAQEG